MDTETTKPHHFVCSECGYSSQHTGSCQTEGCMQEGSPLRQCSCEDGKHAGVMNKHGEDGEDGSSRTLDLDSDEFKG
jgi:hypothetical protein